MSDTPARMVELLPQDYRMSEEGGKTFVDYEPAAASKFEEAGWVPGRESRCSLEFTRDGRILVYPVYGEG